MYPHFQQMLAWTLVLSMHLTTLLAQNNIPLDSAITKKTTPFRLQHSVSLGTAGLQYDMRIRTQNPLLDYYFATNLSGNSSGLQGGVLIGKKTDLSFVAGLAVLSLPDYQSVIKPFSGTNVAIGLPIGIRSQPDSRGLFVQAQYMPILGGPNGMNLRSNTPQIHIGYTFGKKPPRDTLPTPQGIQESFFLELNPNRNTNLRYDARFRTKSTWLDWAAHGIIGTNALDGSVGDTYLRNNWSANAGVGVSALMGKKALSFELGTRINTYFNAPNSFVGLGGAIPNQLSDKVWNSSGAEIFGGLRYQPPHGGVTLMLGTGMERNLNRNPNFYSTNQPQPLFDRFNLRFGLGYSLGTKSKK
jgi:hypothetical protein